MNRKQFDDYLKSGAANNITVGILTGVGLLCGAKSFTGTQTNLVEYCFKPNNSPQFCTPEKRYVMPENEFNAEAYAPSNPEFQRDNFVPAKATRLRLIPASNPYKPLWGIAGFLCLGGAYVLSKGRENRLIELIPQYREQVKTSWLINKIKETLQQHKAAYTAQLDYEFHQWQEDRNVKTAQLAAMSPQELAIYQQQVRLQAQVEAQQQLQQIIKPAGELPGQSLDDVIKTEDKVTGVETPGAIAASAENWFNHAVDHFCVLVWGGQNGGKTTAASHIIKARKDRGDRIVVLDPHAEKDQWSGLEVIGAGMDYQAIDKFMQWYFEECQRRYQLLRSEGKEAVRQLGAICLVAEELTNFAKRCKHSGEFMQACLSDNRKIFFNCVFISHGRTITLTGNAKGTAQTRDDSFLELHTIPPTGGNARQWSVKYPGNSEFIPVTVPNWETILDFGDHASQEEFADLPTAQLSESATTTLEIIKAGTPPVSFESIRKSRKWGDNAPGREQIREALIELVRMERIDGNAEIGYTALD